MKFAKMLSVRSVVDTVRALHSLGWRYVAFTVAAVGNKQQSTPRKEKEATCLTETYY